MRPSCTFSPESRCRILPALTKVRFRDLKERFLPGLVVQTFTISGIDKGDKSFEVAAVDLYTIEKGLIAKKDTYWKFGRPDGS